MKGYVILIAAVAALGGLLFGFDTAVIAGTLQYLTRYFHLTDSALGLIVAAASIGCIPGALMAGRLADRFGRKKLMIVTSLLYIIAALGSGFAGSFNALLVYRLIGGVAIGMASTLAPIYISEIAPAAFRGRLGMLQQLAIVLGILFSFLSNYLIVNSSFSFLNEGNYWRYMLAAAFIPSLVFFLLLLLVPESPRWLILNGRLPTSERIFGKIYGAELAKGQVEAVKENINSEGAARIRDVFAPRYKRTVIIGLVFASIAQLTGINIIFYYAPLIFEKTKVGGSILFQTLLTGIVNLIFTIVAFWLIDRMGRKKLLLMGSWIMGLCMFVLGAVFFFNKLDNYFVLASVFVYIAGFACSWGAVLWVYVAEIFPNRIRGTATSVAVFGNWVANSIVSFTFPIMLSGLGPAVTFFVYGVINLSMILFVSRYVFETKGVPLEKIEELYATV
jgi:sugar porter (SP) family MFS transporter